MKKGSSYIYLTEKDINHPIIGEFIKNGFTEIELVYASHWATDAGWTVLSCKSKNKKLNTYPSHLWIGYTKESALKYLNELFKKHTIQITQPHKQP